MEVLLDGGEEAGDRAAHLETSSASTWSTQKRISSRTLREGGAAVLERSAILTVARTISQGQAKWWCSSAFSKRMICEE